MNDFAKLGDCSGIMEICEILAVSGTRPRVLVIAPHPDDEPSAVLAYLRSNYAAECLIGCVNRGEGGGNAISEETGERLGVLRVREMNAAAAVLGTEVVFIDTGNGIAPDFGYTLDPEATFAHWNYTALYAKIFALIEQFKPHIILEPYGDVEGEHGQHRAVARTARRVYNEGHFAVLPAYFFSAVSGSETEAIPVAAIDPVAGCDYRELGYRSMCQHRSQSMGSCQLALSERVFYVRLMPPGRLEANDQLK